MKKSFMSISMLVVSISMLALFLCSSAMSAQTVPEFVYDKGENEVTVYTVDSTGKYLTPKLKYEYDKEAEEGKETKTAYRWNANEQGWTPYYVVRMSESESRSVVEYAVWNRETGDFSLNYQKAVYVKGAENDILSYMLYKWNPVVKDWEADQALLCGDYLAQKGDGVN